MTIILNNDQVIGARLDNPEKGCEVADLKLNYQQFIQITECKEKTFNILITNRIKPIILKRCVKCAWGYVNKEGYTHMQINYWDSELVEINEYRDILISNLI